MINFNQLMTNHLITLVFGGAKVQIISQKTYYKDNLNSLITPFSQKIPRRNRGIEVDRVLIS